jgi:diaminohydroxyphosphoribosylaminopyrimidine deaminase / 5-amino-6-(5-phosphoribosylamino)uracil reductase
LNHETYMLEALALAPRGRGWVSPNPMVGALVVKDRVVIGRGWHQKFGGPHAEIFALQEAGERARGATLYCTLEPCNHAGKTPPCVDAVLRAGVAAVVLGAKDPHTVAAGGADVLRAKGVNVVTGILDAQCREINAVFFKRVRTGLPLISLKWAMTLDGKIATASGDSKWITSAEARTHAHQLRAEHDAVLIGVNTLLVDQARLNARVENSQIRQPRRVILDSAARTPLDAALFQEANAGPVVVLCAEMADEVRVKALQQCGAEVLRCKTDLNGIDVVDALRKLVAIGVQSVLVEGGGRVLGSFVDARQADQVFVFVAPKIAGGAQDFGAVAGRGNEKIAQALPLDFQSVERVGVDVVLRAKAGNWHWLHE